MLNKALLLGAALFAVQVFGADVREFGAVGDGVADDTEAIQRAVAAGGAVEFPTGTYRITKPVTVELNKAGLTSLVADGTSVIEMAGAGPAFHFMGTVRRSASPNDFSDEVWTKELMPLVDGLAFLGTHPDAVGIQATRVMQLTVTRSHFRRLKHGLHLTERNRNVLIGDCHFYDNRGIGIFLDGVDLHQINVGNSHISYNWGGGIVVGNGSAVRNLQVSGCDIEANMHPDSPPTANILLDSTGGSIGEVEITGCTIQHYTRNHEGHANIRFIGHSTKVRHTDEHRHGQLVISGNMINDADTNIHLDGVRSAVITGNTIHYGPKHDILIENSANIVLSGNVFDRHPRYQYNDSVRQGIVFLNSTGCLISSLHINGGQAPAAIAIHGGSHFQVSNCSIFNVSGTGLLMENVRDSFVSGNFITAKQGESALRVTGGGDNVVSGNRFVGLVDVESGSAVVRE